MPPARGFGFNKGMVEAIIGRYLGAFISLGPAKIPNSPWRRENQVTMQYLSGISSLPDAHPIVAFCRVSPLTETKRRAKECGISM